MIKKTLTAVVVLLCGCLAFAENCPNCPEKRPLKILMVGNSFSAPLVKALPTYGDDLGVKMDLCSLYIGGCSLKQQARYLNEPQTKAYYITSSYASCDKGQEPFAKLLTPTNGGFYAALPEMLAADKWDVVTIQQASHDSWRAETYEPYGTELIAGIRKLAPQAKIYLHETWSYTPWDKRLAKWGISAAEMYEKLHLAYRKFATDHDLEIIPVGTAVQLYRSRLPVKYGEQYNKDDVCGTEHFKQVDGKWVPDGDVFHFNPRGYALQSFVWLAKIFKVNACDGKLNEPPCLAGQPERTKLMRLCAMDAILFNDHWHRD